MAGPHLPLSTLRRAPHGTLRMTRGQCGSLYLSLCKTFTHYSLPVSRRTDFDHTHLLVQPGMIAQETANGLERRFVSAFVNQLIQQANKELAGAGGALDAKQIDDRITQGLGEPIQDLPELAKRLQTLMATLKVTQ